MISLIVPFYNEEENISFVIKEVFDVLEKLNEPYEIVAIDDCSTDNTLEKLIKLKNEIKNLRVLKAEKNGGQSSAVWAGIISSKGDILITIDGDGQNDPSIIPEMLQNLKDFQMVIGVREKRKDSLWKKFSSKIANFFRRLILKDHFKDIGCGLRVFRKEVLKYIPPFKTIHRFLPILVAWSGYKILEVKVNHRERFGGKSKYGTWKRLINGLYDLNGMRWLYKRLIVYNAEEK